MRIINIWENNLKTRRLAYWQSYRYKNIAKKYTKWSELDTVILPQWLQRKAIPNESANLTKRRKKQVLDNLKTEIEILQLRHENQEEKYRVIDGKMKEEISKFTIGESRNALVKLWEEECERNEIISQKHWEKKNAPWFVKYEETFRKKYENKNPYIKIGENDRPRTYAQVTSNTTSKPPQPRPNRWKGYQEPPANSASANETNQKPFPQRAQQPPRPKTTRQNRGKRMESAEYYRPNRAQVPEHPTRKDETSVDNVARRIFDENNQLSFLGRGRGRGRGRGKGQNRGRSQSRGRNYQY